MYLNIGSRITRHIWGFILELENMERVIQSISISRIMSVCKLNLFSHMQPWLHLIIKGWNLFVIVECRLSIKIFLVDVAGNVDILKQKFVFELHKQMNQLLGWE